MHFLKIRFQCEVISELRKINKPQIRGFLDDQVILLANQLHRNIYVKKENAVLRLV